MPRSTLTVAELEVAALLLGNGVWYDPRDHTFNGTIEVYCVDADTMKPSDNDYDERCRLVKYGKLGASDYV